MLDVQIADMDGLTRLRMVRQTDASKELPVIVISDHRSDQQVAEAFEWGADDFVLKKCPAPERSARIEILMLKAGRFIETVERFGYRFLAA